MTDAPRRLLLLPIACLLAALLALAGCGGGDDGGLEGPEANGDTDPATVLDSALGDSGQTIESGVLELAVDATGGAQTVNASIEGPFQSNGEDELPSLDFDVSVNAQTGGAPVGFEGNLTLTPDGLFVGYGGSTFELDEATFQLLQSSYAQSSQLQQDQDDSGGSLSQFGIEPSSWLTNLTNEGTEDIEGTETVHVSGDADIPKLVADLGRVAQATGELDAAGLSQLQDSVEAASIDVYADASNSALRRLDVNLSISAPNAGTEELTFSIGIADPNSGQNIEAPGDAQPLEDLLSQVPGLAESLGGIGGGALPQGGTGGSGAQAPAPADPAATQKYYDCVAGATSSEEILDCQKHLGG